MPKRGYTTAFGRGNASHSGPNWGQRWQKLKKYAGYASAAATAWDQGQNFYKAYKGRNRKLTRKIKKNSFKVGTIRARTTPPEANGWGVSRVSIKKKSPKIFKGISFAPTCLVETANTWSVSSTTGLGAQTPQANTLSRQTVNNITNGPAYVLWAGAQDILNLIVKGNNTNATQVALGAIGTNTTNGYVHYKGVSGCHEFTNAEPTNVEVTIYMLVHKQDEQSAVDVGDPATVWEEGLNEMAGLVGNTGANVYMPMTTPGMSKKFTDTYKILKKTNIRLNPGQTHKYFWSHFPNKIISFSKLAEKWVLGGITIAFLIVTKGAPVSLDTLQTHAAAVNIAYSPQKLVGITTTKYASRTATRPSAIRNQTNNIYATLPGKIWEINDDSGLVLDVQPVTAAA